LPVPPSTPVTIGTTLMAQGKPEANAACGACIAVRLLSACSQSTEAD
jgi:hypothetical protein